MKNTKVRLDAYSKAAVVSRNQVRRGSSVQELRASFADQKVVGQRADEVQSIKVQPGVESHNLAAVLVAAQKLHYHAKRAHLQDQKPQKLFEQPHSASVSSSQKIFDPYQPWRYVRLFFKVCKVFVAVCLAWIFIIGQPMKLVEAGQIFCQSIYQGINCSLSSDAKTGFTCDK